LCAATTGYVVGTRWIALPRDKLPSVEDHYLDILGRPPALGCDDSEAHISHVRMQVRRPRADDLARKEAEGKVSKGALRCLKRHLARRFHRTAEAPCKTPAPPASDRWHLLRLVSTLRWRAIFVARLLW
jgi:hypothetical protein